MGFASGFSAGNAVVTNALDRQAEEKRQEQELIFRRAQEQRAAAAEARAQEQFQATQGDANRVRGLRMQLDNEMTGVDPTRDGGSQFMGPSVQDAGPGMTGPRDYQTPQPGYTADPRKTLGTRQRLANAAGQDLSALNTEAKGYRVDDIYKTRGKEWMSMKDADKQEWLKNHTKGDIPLFGTLQEKGKYTVFALGGKAQTLSDAEMQHLYVAEGLMDEDPQGAMKIMEAGSTKLRNLAKDLVATQAQIAGVNNTAAAHAEADARGNAHLGIARENQAMGRLGSAIPLEGENGEAQMYIPTLGKNGLTLNRLDLPKGTRLPRKGAEGPKDSDIIKAAEGLVGTPSGKMVNRKEVPHTYETALVAAAEKLRAIRAPGGAAQGGAPDVNALAKAIREQGARGAPAANQFQTMPLAQLRDVARGGNPEALQALQDRLYHGAPEEIAPDEAPQRRGMVIDRGY